MGGVFTGRAAAAPPARARPRQGGVGSGRAGLGQAGPGLVSPHLSRAIMSACHCCAAAARLLGSARRGNPFLSLPSLPSLLLLSARASSPQSSPAAIGALCPYSGCFLPHESRPGGLGGGCGGRGAPWGVSVGWQRAASLRKGFCGRGSRCGAAKCSYMDCFQPELEGFLTKTCAQSAKNSCEQLNREVRLGKQEEACCFPPRFTFSVMFLCVMSTDRL